MSALINFVRHHPGLSSQELAKRYAEQEGVNLRAAQLEIAAARKEKVVRELRHRSGSVLIYRNFQLRRGN